VLAVVVVTTETRDGNESDGADGNTDDGTPVEFRHNNEDTTITSVVFDSTGGDGARVRGVFAIDAVSAVELNGLESLFVVFLTHGESSTFSQRQVRANLNVFRDDFTLERRFSGASDGSEGLRDNASEGTFSDDGLGAGSRESTRTTHGIEQAFFEGNTDDDATLLITVGEVVVTGRDVVVDTRSGRGRLGAQVEISSGIIEFVHVTTHLRRVGESELDEGSAVPFEESIRGIVDTGGVVAAESTLDGVVGVVFTFSRSTGFIIDTRS